MIPPPPTIPSARVAPEPHNAKRGVSVELGCCEVEAQEEPKRGLDVTWMEVATAWLYTMAIMWPTFLIVGAGVGYLESLSVASIHVAWMIIMSLLVVWKWGHNVHLSFFFVVWGALLAFTLWQFTKMSQTGHQANMAKQCLALLNQEFRYEDTKFWKEFKDIENAEDIYQFMKGPVAGVLYAPHENLENGAGSEVPSLIDNGNYNASSLIAVTGCFIRQVRIKPTACKKMVPGPTSDDTERTRAYRERVNCIDDFEMDGTYMNEERTPRHFERWKNDRFMNKRRVSTRSVSFMSSISQIEYPGVGGMVMGGINETDPVTGEAHQTGLWPSVNYLNYNPDIQIVNQTEFYSQIGSMESNRWIDQYTSLVQVTCEFENININTAMSILMSIEFTRAGVVLPEAPFVGVGPALPHPVPGMFSPVLLLGFYPLFCRVCLFVLVTKFVEKKALSLYHLKGSDVTMLVFAALTCMACIATWYFDEVIRVGDMTPAVEDHHEMYSIYTYRYNSQIAHGFVFMLCSLFALALCDVIPRFNVIGRTLHRSVPHLLRFMVLMMIVMVGFGLLFWTVYRTTVMEFRYPTWALFTLFRGMLGDMPLDDMLYFYPLTTKVLFVLFTFFVVFVIFNVVIAIIMDAYSDVKDETEAEAKQAETLARNSGETHHDSILWCVPSCCLDIPVIGWCLRPTHADDDDQDEDDEGDTATNQYLMAQKIEEIHRSVSGCGGISEEKFNFLLNQMEEMNRNIQTLQQQLHGLARHPPILPPL